MIAKAMLLLTAAWVSMHASVSPLPWMRLLPCSGLPIIRPLRELLSNLVYEHQAASLPD